MKKTVAVLLALTMCLGVLSACGQEKGSSDGGTLNLYTWAGMFDPDVIEGFEKETGIKVNYVNFDYDETMLAKLEAADGGDYDLVIADDYIIETVIAEGLAQKLDTSKLSNYANINPIYQGQFYDPNDEYTVPYGSGVQTIAYDPDAVDIDINGYEDLWNPALSDSLAVIGNYRVIVGMALKVLGYSYNTNNLDEIEEAGELLYTLADNIRLIKDDNVQDDLISGEVSAAVMYTSQVTLARLANPNIKTVYPSEGIGFGIMGMFIPSKAPNAEAAYKFIDYILDAEIGAKCFEYLGYYCTNKAAEEYISDEMKELIVLPEEFSADDMEMIATVSAEAGEKMSEVWTEFKTRCGQ